jgi:hypothetical protein
MPFGRPVKPVAAKQGGLLAKNVACSCTYQRGPINIPPVIAQTNPTCPIHGAGRPAGSGK